MKPHRQDELAIANQAAEWLTALEEGDAGQRAAFAEWLVQSPVHVREFLNLTAVHRLFDDIDPQRRMDVQAMFGDFAGNVVALSPEKKPHLTPSLFPPRGRRGKMLSSGGSRMRWAVGIAAGVALTVASAWWSFTLAGWQSYATAIGEQRSIELDDGSLVYLSAQSRLQARVDDEVRDIRLMHGEALFTVQRDARRPFRVHAGSAVIQAVGTRFNVNRRTRDTAVAVIEGAVRVYARGEQKNTPVLAAGEEVRIASDGAISPPSTVDTARVIAWRERRLVFQADTLEDMAAEFNRYNHAPRIRIGDDAIRQRRFTGVLDASRPESLLDLLAEADDLVYEKRDDEIIIQARK